MEQDVASKIGTHGTPLGGKAWTAYIGPVLLALILFGAALPLAFHWSEWAAAGVMVFTVLVVGYRVLLLRSYRLYRGILPWSKGLVGVKWRDMDEATFTASFWSWLLRSYTIRVGHRFTKSSEIMMTQMAGGKNAVTVLNTQLQNLIRANRLG